MDGPRLHDLTYDEMQGAVAVLAGCADVIRNSSTRDGERRVWIDEMADERDRAAKALSNEIETRQRLSGGRVPDQATARALARAELLNARRLVIQVGNMLADAGLPEHKEVARALAEDFSSVLAVIGGAPGGGQVFACKR